MKELAALYYQFWSQFTGVAYDSSRGADGLAMPYISYTGLDNDIFVYGLQQVIVWVQSGKSLEPLLNITDEIRKAIPHTGKVLILPSGEGGIILRRGSPFMQPYPQEEDSIKAMYINVEVESLIL